jgi:hypothetical protein
MMGELEFFLGFQIKQMKEGTFLCQTKYVKDMLKRFDMADYNPIKTPMALNGHLDLNEEGKSVDQKVFRSMIGSCRCFRPENLPRGYPEVVDCAVRIVIGRPRTRRYAQGHGTQDLYRFGLPGWRTLCPVWGIKYDALRLVLG